MMGAIIIHPNDARLEVFAGAIDLKDFSHGQKSARKK
jgi:hypothetical protein